MPGLKLNHVSKRGPRSRVEYKQINNISYQMETHYCDVIMSAMASQITGVSIVCSIVGSGGYHKTSKLRVTPLCRGFTGEFPAQKVSNAENVSIWWRHHAFSVLSAFSVLPVTSGFLSQRRVTRSFNVLFDMRLKNKTAKQTVRMPVSWDTMSLIVTSL